VQRGGEAVKSQLAELQQERHAADAELRAGGDNARLLGQQLEGRAQEVAAYIRTCACTCARCMCMCMLMYVRACACACMCVRTYACECNGHVHAHTT